MNVASGIIALWTGTHASVPSGWSRKTSLDSKYPLGAANGENGGGTGGSATHTHTVADHNHATSSHTHTFSGGASTSTTAADDGIDGFSADGHTHASVVSNSAAVTSNDATGVTMDAISNDPPFVRVIFIESDGTPTGIPDDASVLWEGGSLPSGWNENDGGAGRMDLRGRFLRGAATAADAGGTGGSSDAHSHTEDGTKHTHTMPDHNHGSKASNNATPTGISAIYENVGDGAAKVSHNHLITFNNSSAMSLTNTSDTTKITSQNADGQPPFLVLQAIQNENGAESFPTGIVCLWLGTLASIPADWVILDGSATNEDMRDRFVKIKSAGTSIGDTGGADTHTHTANSHNHNVAGNTHNHTVTQGLASSATNSVIVVHTQDVAIVSHTHSWTIGNASPSVTSTAKVVTINSSSSKANYPEYVKAIFLKYSPAAVGAGERSVHTMHIGLGLSRL